MKALFLAALLILSATAQVDQDMQKLERMQQSSFGKSLLATIALQLETEDPADDLIHMLQDLEDKLEDEQSEADDFILALENQCVIDLAILVEEIEETRVKIQQLEDLLAEIVPLKAKKEDEKADLEDFRDLIEEKLMQMAMAKQQKDEEWAAEATEHDQLTAVITKAKNIIAGALGGFLQTSASAKMEILAQVSNEFTAARKQHFIRKSYNGIFRVMAQIASTSPVQTASSTVDHILELCDDLLEKIAESRAIEKADYDHWMNEYNKTKDALNIKLEDTINAIQKLTIEINVLTKQINMATESYEEQKERLVMKISQHDEHELMCDTAGNNYSKEREERSEQKEIISDAIGLLMSKIRLLKQYVGDSVSTLTKPMF